MAVAQRLDRLHDGELMLARARAGFFKPEMRNRISSLEDYLTDHGRPVTELVSDICNGRYGCE
jgi:hypothetical protein